MKKVLKWKIDEEMWGCSIRKSKPRVFRTLFFSTFIGLQTMTHRKERKIMKKGRRKRKKEKEKEKGKWEKGNGKKGKREKEKWKMERGSKAGPKAVSSRGIESVSAMIVLSFPLSFFFLSFFFLFSFLLLVTREKIGKEREECVRIHKQKIRRKQLYYNFQLTCTVWGSQLSEKGIKLRLPGVDRLDRLYEETETKKIRPFFSFDFYFIYFF